MDDGDEKKGPMDTKRSEIFFRPYPFGGKHPFNSAQLRSLMKSPMSLL